MSTEENKATVRRWIEEGWNRRYWTVFDELAASTWIYHDPSLPTVRTRQDYTRWAGQTLGAFPDNQVTIEEMLADQDQVAVRHTFRGTHTGTIVTPMRLPATGKPVTVPGMTIVRLAGGKGVEVWNQVNTLGLLHQLGVMPAPEAASQDLPLGEQPEKGVTSLSTEDNKVATRRGFEEGWNHGKVAVFDELFAPTFRYRDPALPTALDTQGYKQLVTAMRQAFPDLQITVEDLIAEGDQVAVRLTLRGTHTSDLVTVMRLPATGKQVTESMIAFIRFTGGKAVEVWSQGDTLGFLQQLGVIPAPGQASSSLALRIGS
jgi:steroid delta-isomerase-like uncharacterized protein